MLKVGARGSNLSRVYAEKVCKLLPMNAEIVVIKTIGDIHENTPIHEIGGKGVFCSTIESQLLNGNIDIAVHSLKDMPGEETEGLIVNAVLKRNSPYDVIVGKIFKNAKIGTSSPRRKAQIINQFPDVKVCDIRGNVDTRLSKLNSGEYDAIVLAQAGLDCLNIKVEYDVLPSLPAIGQGIIAVQTRINDNQTNSIVAEINHKPTYIHAMIERDLLKGVGGDCHTMVAGHATGNKNITLKAEYYFEDYTCNKYSSTVPINLINDLGYKTAQNIIKRN